MFLLQSDELLSHVDAIIHRETQQHKTHIDLTAAEILRHTGPGSLDFGGSEFEKSETNPLSPKKQDPGDDYGWWALNPGIYKARFNEEIKLVDDALLAISPHPHLREAGVIANTHFVSSDMENPEMSLNFHVPATGCNIKENARIAVLYILAE